MTNIDEIREMGIEEIMKIYELGEVVAETLICALNPKYYPHLVSGVPLEDVARATGLSYGSVRTYRSALKRIPNLRVNPVSRYGNQVKRLGKKHCIPIRYWYVLNRALENKGLLMRRDLSNLEIAEILDLSESYIGHMRSILIQVGLATDKRFSPEKTRSK